MRNFHLFAFNHPALKELLSSIKRDGKKARKKAHSKRNAMSNTQTHSQICIQRKQIINMSDFSLKKNKFEIEFNLLYVHGRHQGANYC